MNNPDDLTSIPRATIAANLMRFNVLVKINRELSSIQKISPSISFSELVSLKLFHRSLALDKKIS